MGKSPGAAESLSLHWNLDVLGGNRKFEGLIGFLQALASLGLGIESTNRG
jgi:hypothetical protein